MATYMWRWEDELVLSFHHVGPKDWTLTVRFSGKCLNQLSHLNSPPLLNSVSKNMHMNIFMWLKMYYNCIIFFIILLWIEEKEVSDMLSGVNRRRNFNLYRYCQLCFIITDIFYFFPFSENIFLSYTIYSDYSFLSLYFSNPSHLSSSPDVISSCLSLEKNGF